MVEAISGDRRHQVDGPWAGMASTLRLPRSIRNGVGIEQMRGVDNVFSLEGICMTSMKATREGGEGVEVAETRDAHDDHPCISSIDAFSILSKTC